MTEKAVAAESRRDVCLQFEDGELQQRRNFPERNATWQMMQLSCLHRPPPASANLPSINALASAPASAATSCSSSSTAITAAPVTPARQMDPKLIKTQKDFSFFEAPSRDSIAMSRLNCSDDMNDQEDNHCLEPQTLQLFPLRSEETDDDKESSEPSASASLMTANFLGDPSQFYEFLPLKNQ